MYLSPERAKQRQELFNIIEADRQKQIANQVKCDKCGADLTLSLGFRVSIALHNEEVIITIRCRWCSKDIVFVAKKLLGAERG